MKHPKKPVRRLCAAGLLAVLAAVGWYENYTVRVLTQTIASARLPEGFDGFRIAQIADLHAREFGTDNAQLIDAGKLVLIHITDTGRVIYGKEETSGQKKFDEVDTANGTVTFTTDSCSPFVLAHKAGVSVKGKVASYNGSHDFTVTLYQTGSNTMVGTPLTVSGNGATEQEFTIPTVAPGTYDLVVSKPGHLKYTVKNVVVETTDLDLTAMAEKPFSTIKLLCGDVDGDGQINVTDLNKVWDAANFNKDANNATNKLTDLDGDGSVNVTDLNILWDAANFNKGMDNCTFQFK